MDAAHIYRETLKNLALAISAHQCPDGRASVRAFCHHYGFNRPHLCQLLLGTCKEEMSVGLYLRLVAALGLCSAPPNTQDANSMSLRQYLKVDATTVQRTIMQLEFS